MSEWVHGDDPCSNPFCGCRMRGKPDVFKALAEAQQKIAYLRGALDAMPCKCNCGLGGNLSMYEHDKTCPVAIKRDALKEVK